MMNDVLCSALAEAKFIEDMQDIENCKNLFDTCPYLDDPEGLEFSEPCPHYVSSLCDTKCHCIF